MREYDLTDRAVRDITAARDWYDKQNVDLGERFFNEVLLAIRAVREHPDLIQSFRARNVR